MTTKLLYQLLDTASGNYIGAYATRAAALASAREVFCLHGADYVSELALTHTDDQGNILNVIEGTALLDQVPRIPL
jgi:hypothetical protein